MKEEFKSVYDQLKLSEESKQKLLNLKASEKPVKKFKIRYAAVAAVMIGIYLMSDLVTYAATGETLTHHVYNLITFDDNGDAELKDGSKVHVDIEDDVPFEVNVYEITDEEGTENGIEIDIGDKED